MRRAAAGGLSSGNALRETEGKTSRGRSAVIGLETDLKGKVGAVAAAEALPALPSAHPSLACQDPGLRLCPGQPPMGQIAQEGQERGDTQPLTAETRANVCPPPTYTGKRILKRPDPHRNTQRSYSYTKAHMHTNTIGTRAEASVHSQHKSANTLSPNVHSHTHTSITYSLE